MTSKTGSQTQIRVVKEEFLPPQLDLEEMPPSPSETQEKERRLREAVAAVTAPPLLAAPPRQPSATETTEAQSFRDLSRGFQAMLGVCLTISMVLAVRLMLLVAVLSATVLAWRTLEHPETMSLLISAGFNLGVVAPIVALYWKRG